MTPMKSTFLLLAFAALGLVGLSSCATPEDGTATGSYPAPDPLEQQVRMQEGMSRVTNSLIP